jgi:hypothetical protein
MFVRIVLGLLGAMFLSTGVVQTRAFRASAGDHRSVRTGVGVLAGSRLIAGASFVAAAAFSSLMFLAIGGSVLLAGTVAAEVAHRRLKSIEPQ